jgi:hypothetical protein
MKLKNQLEELLTLLDKAKAICNEMPEFYKPADAAFIAIKDVANIAEDALFELETAK